MPQGVLWIGFATCHLLLRSMLLTSAKCYGALLIPEGCELEARVLRHEKRFSNGVVLPEGVDIPHQQLQVAIPCNAAKPRAYRHLCKVIVLLEQSAGVQTTSNPSAL
jgi:hypothetical protein